MKLRGLLFVVLLCGSGCGPINPYVRAGNHMLQHYSMKFCWAPADSADHRSSCVSGQVAQPVLDRCIAQLRSHVGLFTSEEIADKEIGTCMHAAGWKRIWIDGVMLLN